MLTELFTATAMVLLTVFIHAVGLVLLGRLTRYEAREEQKLNIKPLSMAGVSLTVAVVLGLFVLHAAEIWLYAALYLELGAIDTLRHAVYFSTQTYAAIGFGDELLDPGWQLLAAIEGINGVILLGWSTAFFVTGMRRLGHL
ncbi:ion channel [Sandarakinorhabdus sp.]|uniref:ion channel n=1 Tax=Sandarakinorhabdus sp. TaxID=1916663 RepID=UPI00286DE128|nr:ion channel [Sandarakinorhabdus sp.]